MKFIAKSHSRCSNKGILKVQLILMMSIFLIGNAWSVEPQHKKQNGRDQHAKTEQRGTENSPVYFKGEVTTRQDKEESERDAKEHEVKAVVDATLANYTFWLAILTGGLLLAAAIQAGLFIWQLGLMRRATIDSGVSAKAAEKAANIAERSLTDLERSWLFIESVRVVRREGAPIQPEIPNNWYISFVWRNVGRAPALIKDCILKIEDRDALPPIPDYSNSSPLTCQQTLSSDKTFETNQIGPSHDKRVKAEKPIRLIAYGKLTYKDLSGKEHHTGFATEVSAHLPAANTYENEAYEYYD